MEKKAAGGEEDICRRTGGKWRCKNPASADNKHHYCEKHYKLFEMKRNNLPPQDEKLCSRTGNTGLWRCKDFRMNSETKYCEKHFKEYIEKYKKKYKKKKTRNGGAGPKQEIKASKRGKKITEEDQEDEDGTSDTIVEGGESAKFGTKRKKKSLTKTREPVVETRALKRRKMITEGDHFDGKGGCSSASGIETNKDSNCSKRRKKVTEDADPSLDGTGGIEPDNGDDPCAGKKKTVEKAEGRSGQLESITRTREPSNCSKRREKLPATTNDTSHCDAIIEGGTANIGRKRKNVERTKGSRDLVSLARTRGHVGEIESPEHYKRKCFELSAELEKMKVEIKMKKVELEKKDVDHEKTRVELVKKNVEHERIQVELQKKNVELEKKKVECTELHGKLEELETRLTAANDMQVMNNRNMNKYQEIRWKSEEDMLSSFQEDSELYMKAVCTLYRQHIHASGEEISAKGLHIDLDTVRCTTLAMFLMDGDCKGDLKKSLKELAAFDAEAVDSCKKLAKRYSPHLFDIYQKGDDPFFPSMCNCRPRRSNC